MAHNEKEIQISAKPAKSGRDLLQSGNVGLSQIAP